MASKTYATSPKAIARRRTGRNASADVPPDEKIEVSVYLKPHAAAGAAEQAEPFQDAPRWRAAGRGASGRHPHAHRVRGRERPAVSSVEPASGW